jgi:hypothetical protein
MSGQIKRRTRRCCHVAARRETHVHALFCMPETSGDEDGEEVLGQAVLKARGFPIDLLQLAREIGEMRIRP